MQSWDCQQGSNKLMRQSGGNKSQCCHLVAVSLWAGWLSILVLHFLICAMGILIIVPSQDNSRLSLLGSPIASTSYNHLTVWSNVFSLSLSLLCPLLITLHGLQIFISLIPLMNHVWGLHRLRAHNNADILLNLKATIREEKIHTHMVHLAFRFSNPP